MTEEEGREEEIELVHGTGNVWRDLGFPDADVLQAKTMLGIEIMGILEDRKLSTRDAEKITGVSHSDFVRIRRAQFNRFTIDRLIKILGKFGQKVEIQVSSRPRDEGFPEGVVPAV